MISSLFIFIYVIKLSNFYEDYIFFKENTVENFISRIDNNKEMQK
jgi:hypothetical protein